MNVTILIPDEFARRFKSEVEASRRLLEGLGLQEYRAGRLSRPDLLELRGFSTRWELDGLLKGHGVIDSLTVEEVDEQLQSFDRIGS